MRRLLSLAFLFAFSTAAGAADAPYHLIKEIPIGGVGGWDYVTVDPAAHRLYVSHATRIVVVDLDAGKVSGEIPDTPGVHGFALAADLGRGFSSNGRANTSTIIDLKTLKPLGTVATGGNPDAIMYEPSRKEVYTFNGAGKSVTVFDAQTGKVAATIAVGGKPEAAVIDREANRVYVNLEDTGAIAALDIPTHKLVGTWRLEGCEEPTGLGFDAKRHRLFSACANKVLVATDSVSGKQVSHVSIGDGADGAAFDPVTGDIFTSNGGEGTVTIARLDAGDKLTVVQTLPTQISARTMILDPVTHMIYLPAATMRAAGGARPAPENFRVLVYGMN